MGLRECFEVRHQSLEICLRPAFCTFMTSLEAMDEHGFRRPPASLCLLGPESKGCGGRDGRGGCIELDVGQYATAFCELTAEIALRPSLA